jgi:hypothetical protein
MSDENWEVTVADVSEVEAKVRIRYRGAGHDELRLSGTLRGPYCERAHTLPADYPLQPFASEPATVEAIVTDPCLWSEELPHLYQAFVQAIRGEAVVAEYHGVVGLRRTSPHKNWDHIK